MIRTNGKNEIVLTMLQKVVAGLAVVLIGTGMLAAVAAYMDVREIKHRVERIDLRMENFITKDVFREHVRRFNDP